MNGVVYGLGAIATLLGLAGMAEAVTDNGSFLVSAVVFSVGFTICLVNMKGEKKHGRN